LSSKFSAHQTAPKDTVREENTDLEEEFPDTAIEQSMHLKPKSRSMKSLSKSSMHRKQSMGKGFRKFIERKRLEIEKGHRDQSMQNGFRKLIEKK